MESNAKRNITTRWKQRFIMRWTSILLTVPATIMTGIFFLMNMDFRIFMATMIFQISIGSILSIRGTKHK
jgi:hypothetical protein